MNEAYRPKISPEVTETNANEDETYDEVLDLIDLLPETPYKTAIKEKIEDEKYDSFDELLRIRDTIADKIEKIKEIRKAKFVSFNLEQWSSNLDDEQAQKTQTQILFELERIKSKTENFLGGGRTAEVFKSDTFQHLCFKIINNPNYLKLGDNSVIEEFNFIEELSNLEIDGVRVPKPYYAASSQEFQIIVMETLPGVTLESIFRGDASLPQDFDSNVFIGRIQRFVEIMHSKNIHHRDLGPQNIMYDEKSDQIFIIDFGRSTHKKLESDDPYRISGVSLKAGKRYLRDDAMIEAIREKFLQLV